jgi:Flp pilus assembly pilin Flp
MGPRVPPPQRRTRKISHLDASPTGEGNEGHTQCPSKYGEDPRMTDVLVRPIIAMQVAVHELREREDGQTTTEYAILLGFLAIAIIIALFFLRNVLRGLFSDASSSVSNAPDS